jgi:adenylate kinase
MVESKMKAGALVPDTMILRLILNEFSKRGWTSDGPVLPYTLASTGDTSHNHMPVLPAMDALIPSSFAPLTYSSSPSASFILDGFPRNLPQAQQIDSFVPINFVVHLQTPPEIIIDRISNRWVHASSGRVYNTTFNPPQVAGFDDITGDPLTRRGDDDPNVWKERLATFEKAAEGLLAHYEDKGVLWKVEGKSSDEISPKLFEEFERRFI